VDRVSGFTQHLKPGAGIGPRAPRFNQARYGIFDLKYPADAANYSRDTTSGTNLTVGHPSDSIVGPILLDELPSWFVIEMLAPPNRVCPRLGEFYGVR
jgi:hypothetical protein